MSSITTVPANSVPNMGIFSFGDIPGVDTITYNETTSRGGFIFSMPSLATLNVPNLTSVDPTNLANGIVSVNNCSILTTLSLPKLVTANRIVFTNTPALTTINLPKLTTAAATAFGYTALTTLNVPLLATVNGQLELASAPTATLTFPALVTVGGNIVVDSAKIGTTLSFPSLVTVSGSIVASGSPTLANISFPNFLPTNGNNIFFSAGTLLTSVSVNHILARCVANPAYVSGQVFLGGNPPTGQGLVDKATLIGRGVNVVTN